MSTIAYNTYPNRRDRLARFLKEIDYFTHFYNHKSCKLIENPQSYLRAMAQHYPNIVADVDVYLEIRYKIITEKNTTYHPLNRHPRQQYIVRSQGSSLSDLFKKTNKRYGFIFVKHVHKRQLGTCQSAHSCVRNT